MGGGIFHSHLYRNLPLPERVFLRCLGEELYRYPSLLACLGGFIGKKLRCCSIVNLSKCVQDQRPEVCLEYLMLGIWLKCFTLAELDTVARRSLA